MIRVRHQSLAGALTRIRAATLLRLALIAPILLLASCVTVTNFNNPTLPAPEWQLYSDLEVGYALTMPPGWSAFDLNTQIDLAADRCSLDPQVKDSRRQQLTSLHDRGVRLFACDTSRNADPRLPIAYAVAGQVPPDGLDKYLDRTTQVAGRQLLDRRHIASNGGDMVVQKIHERLTAQDGAALDTTQYQFLVIRFNALHLFFVEFPTALQDAVDHDAQLIGTSLTPLH